MNYIEITGADLKDVAKAAYRHSRRQGLGRLYLQETELPDADAETLIESRSHQSVALHMNYVRGRVCKLTVFRRGARLFIHANWFAHTKDDLDALLSDLGMSDAPHLASMPEFAEQAGAA